MNKLQRWFRQALQPWRAPVRRPQRVRPSLESLEDRRVLSSGLNALSPLPAAVPFAGAGLGHTIVTVNQPAATAHLEGTVGGSTGVSPALSTTLTKITQALAGATPAQLKLGALSIPMNSFASSLDSLRVAKQNLLLAKGVRLTTAQQAAVIRLIAQSVRLLPADLNTILSWPPRV